MSSNITYHDYTLQRMLHYISVAETYSPVNEYREKIFTPPHDARMLFHSLDLDTRVLLDSIGFCSLQYTWATTRTTSIEAVDASRLWELVHINYRIDSHAATKTNGRIPEHLARDQTAAVQEVIDAYERNLHALATPTHFHITAFWAPGKETLESQASKAHMGYQGMPTDMASPLFEIMTDPRTPFAHWSSGTPDGQYHISITPNVFHRPIEAWMLARDLDLITHEALPAATIEDIEEIRNRTPVDELLSISVLNEASNRRNDKSIKYVLQYIRDTLRSKN